MGITDVSRRDLLKGGGAGWLGLSALQLAGPAKVFGQASGEVIPWLDQPPPSPFPESVGNLLRWEAVDAWLTPAQNFFFVNHYGQPTLSEATWRLNVTGLVERPLSLTLADLRGRARQEVDFTMECSGNTGTGLDFFIGGIGNARWAGAPLASVLEQAGIKDEATEVIFWGADRGTVTIADNPGIVSPGSTGTGTADSDGGTDLTITEQFARSMSVREALHRDNLLCYEMNGERLPVEHGFPVRLIAPGWYGVANVKWLTRIEVTDQRFTGRFMARDYVTVREQQRDGETVWTFANVGRDRLKSAPAKVTRTGGRYSIMGAAWGAPIKAVEFQIHDGPWLDHVVVLEHALADEEVALLDLALGALDLLREHLRLDGLLLAG
ncbi:MAG TPA: molybdopterin-dependent oxidoreductase, partial [Bryobacteraceae bacterium]|nr:molybdopterin-dependent oxidoreductase [Bryobacteraceae bacterium]